MSSLRHARAILRGQWRARRIFERTSEGSDVQGYRPASRPRLAKVCRNPQLSTRVTERVSERRGARPEAADTALCQRSTNDLLWNALADTISAPRRARRQDRGCGLHGRCFVNEAPSTVIADSHWTAQTPTPSVRPSTPNRSDRRRGRDVALRYRKPSSCARRPLRSTPEGIVVDLFADSIPTRDLRGGVVRTVSASPMIMHRHPAGSVRVDKFGVGAGAGLSTPTRRRGWHPMMGSR